MKKLIYTLPLILTFIECSAQTKLTIGEFKAKHETVVVKNLSTFDSVKHIMVYLKSNKYVNGVPHPKKRPVPISPKDMRVNTDDIKPIVLKVLSTKLSLLKKNREKLDVIFHFNNKGNIIEATFSLNANTLITAEDIEEIDKLLKNNIKATFTGVDYKNYEVIDSNFVPTVVF